MNEIGLLKNALNSYWVRLVVSSVPIGLIIWFSLWVSELYEISTIGYFVIALIFLLVYGYIFEEKYISSWRRETINIED
jgi:hypothetical protein